MHGIGSANPHSAQWVIRAALVGADQCRAEGFTVLGAAPVLAMCRLLVASGFNPARPLHAYRNEILALSVRTIGVGAVLSVKTAGNGAPMFALDRRRLGATGPLVDANSPAGVP